MKYLFFLILSLSFFSCKDECQTCTVEIESNLAAAEAYCRDWVGDPYTVVVTKYRREICDADELQFLKNQQGTETIFIDCDQVWASSFATTRTIVSCK